MTAADVGLPEYGNQIAYWNPGCPEHGIEVDRAYVSTSDSMTVVEKHHRFIEGKPGSVKNGTQEIVRIVIPKGSKAFRLSDKTSESELLLPRNTTFNRNADGSYTASTP